MISLEHKIIISSDVLKQEVAGETVLLDLQSEKYFSLDEIGTRIWQLLQQHKNLQNVLTVMLDEYDVEEKQLKEDLQKLLAQLVEANLVTLVPEKKDEQAS